jgi:hypothetical protein
LEIVRRPVVKIAANIKKQNRAHVGRVKATANPPMTDCAVFGILCMGASLLWESGLFGDNP